MDNWNIWIIVSAFLFLMICKSFIRTIKLKRKIHAYENGLGYSLVSPDTIQEVRNVVNFLKDREHGLGVIDHARLFNSEHIYMCDIKAFHKGSHPKLLALFRAAHLAGYTISVRQKDKRKEEADANAKTCLSEYVTSIN